MFTEKDTTFFTPVINSFVHRRPMVLEAREPRAAEMLRQILSLVPTHRYFIVSGEVPKWARHLPGRPRELPSNDFSALVDAIKSAMEEENLGRRPVQFVYFGANPGIIESLRDSIGGGWIAVTRDADAVRRRLPRDLFTELSEEREGVTALHLGSSHGKMTFERELLSKLERSQKTVATFLVQKKFAEMFLAGSAVRRQLEDGSNSLTLVDLEEQYELDEVTAYGMFNMVQAEHHIDLRRYVSLPDPSISEIVDRLADKVENLVAVAACEKGSVLKLKRLRSSEIMISRTAAELARVYEAAADVDRISQPYHLRISSGEGNKAIAVALNGVVYVAFPDKDARPAICLSTILEELGIRMRGLTG